MTLHLTVPPTQHTGFHPRITVIGVGGGGTNAVDNMIAMGLEGVEFVVANTDAQTLQKSRADRRVQLGPHLTQGLGAGAKPEIGRAAAEEATEELARHLEGTHMVFVTAGMGGGTGTGAAPVVARMARERGVLTVGVVTKPFDFEGRKRQRAAEAGIEELQGVVDTLIVIPNQNLFRQANERTTMAEAFQMADKVLYDGVRGVTELMVRPGKVNLDFADIRTVMAEMGKAMMGTGEAEGEDRAARAAELAISNPLLDDSSLRGAKSMLINIMGGEDVTLFEVEEAVNRIRKEVDEEANIIFGTSLDDTMNGRIVISVVATGIDVEAGREAERPRLVATGGQPAARAYPAPPTQAAPPAAGYPAQTVPHGAGGPGAAAASFPAPSFPAPSFPQGPAPRAAAAPGAGYASPGQGPAFHAPGPQPVPAPRAAFQPEAGPAEVAPIAAPVHEAPVRPAPAPARAGPAGAGPRRPGLFNAVTGLIRGNLQQPAPPAEPPAPPRAPVLVSEPAGSGPGPRPAAAEGTDYEIPSFLRRQGN